MQIMKLLGRILILTGLTLGATSCGVTIPLSVIGTTAVTTAGVVYALTNAEEEQQPSSGEAQECVDTKGHVTSVHKSGAHTIATKSDGTTTTVVDHGTHKFIHHSDGTTSTIIDHGAHTIVHNSDGTTATVIDHGAHKIVVSPDGTHQVIVVP